MIPLCVPNLAGNEARYLQECITSTYVSSVGPFVDRFETMVADAAGAKRAVATSAGTTALHAGLMTVGVKAGDLVICPDLTFIASANAIAHCGAIPWLVDVSPDSWTLDPTLLAGTLATETQKINGACVHRASGRRVAAIVPVYTLGVPADMDPIVLLAQEYGFPVVADGAAALGALYKDRPSGALGADLTMYSFNGNKTATAGGGGAIVGNDAALIDRFRHLTTTARVGTNYDHDTVGYNYRMTNLQAAVGCAQMEQLEGFVAAKRRIASRYNEAFGSIDGFRPFPEPGWATSPAWFSGFMFDTEDGDERSEALRRHLRVHGIDARPFWKPMHLQTPYRDAPKTATPVTDGLWKRIVTLPCSTHLNDADQGRVIETVISWAAET